MASGERRPWTDAERWALAALWDGHGKFWDGWADALPGRSPAAIAAQAQLMGLTWKRKREPWTPEEDACVLRCVLDAAQRTGRAPSAVAGRVAALKRRAARSDNERMVAR